MPPASSSCSLRPASCSPLQTLRFLLYALSVQFSTHASNSPLPASCSPLLASDFLPPALSASTLYSLRPLLSAICFLLPASCALCLYSLLSTHCFCALSSLPSALCFRLPASCALCSLLSPLCSLLSAFRSLLSAPCLLIGTLRKMVFREVVSVGVRAAALPHTEKNACGVRPHVAPPRYLSTTSLPSLHPG